MTLKQKRRAILKSLGIGSVWSTPVVSSVVLPAHASTSNSGEFLSAGTDTFTVPAGVTRLKITVNGAGGGTRNYVKGVGSDTVVGGNGEQVVQTVTSVPGDTLNITVGGGGIDGWAYSPKAPEYQKVPSTEAGKGGTPGEGGTALNNGVDEMGGGGGGFSQVSGTGFSIQAGGGGGGGEGDSIHPAGDGGGTNGGAAGVDTDGGNAGNGLGGKGSDSDPTGYKDGTTVLTHSRGDDGSVIISSI